MASLRVICCANDDEGVEEFRRVFPQPAKITICGGRTMPEALNSAVARLASPDPGDLLCFIHRDARLDFDAPAVLPRYLDVLERPGVLGFCGAKRQTREGRWYASPPLYGTLRQSDRALVFDTPTRGREGLRFEPVETLDGYCLLMLRSVFDRIGGFDEGLDGWHFYDVDVCMRALAAGYANYVLDQPTTHLSWGRSDAEWTRLHGKWLATWEETWFRAQPGLRVAVYTVAGGEPDQAERLMQSCAGVDGVYVLDPGGADGAAGRFRELGAEVASRELEPWRADAVRAAALGLVPETVDVCIALDPGETLATGWRAALDEAWASRTTRLAYRVAELEPDRPAPWTTRESVVHARNAYAWSGPARPSLEPLDGILEVVAETPSVLVERDGRPSDLPHDLPLLELAIRERPDDARRVLHLAGAFLDAQRWWDCIASCRRFLEHPGATSPPERAHACILLGTCFDRMQQPAEAQRWLVRAVSEAPTRREPLVALADLFQARGDHPGAYFAAKAALALQDRAEHPLDERAAWRERPHDHVAVAAYYLGLKEESLREALAAVEENPWDQRLIDNHNLVQELTIIPEQDLDVDVDVIVLAHSRSEADYRMTCRTVGSLRLSSPDVGTNVVVVETNAALGRESFAGEPLFGHGVTTVFPGGPFGYNAFLRAGYETLEASPAPYLLVLNNDVVLFGQGFLDAMIEGLESVDSVSPLGLREATWSGIQRDEPLILGYDVNTVLHGWCVMLDTAMFDTVPFETLFPPEFTFYGQDVEYGAVLEAHGLSHGLVTAAKALHLGRGSHHLLETPAEETGPPSRS